MSKLGLTELINTIQDKAKIEEVIADYVDLQRKGNNYVGLCPFHNDSNPSMSVSPDKKIFKCFSCGAGGNVISFVQNHEGISFIEAIKKLSDKYEIN
jgi:DNA primase